MLSLAPISQTSQLFNVIIWSSLIPSLTKIDQGKPKVRADINFRSEAKCDSRWTEMHETVLARQIRQ
jgi:hypothetical protein